MEPLCGDEAARSLHRLDRGDNPGQAAAGYCTLQILHVKSSPFGQRSLNLSNRWSVLCFSHVQKLLILSFSHASNMINSISFSFSLLSLKSAIIFFYQLDFLM